MPKYIDKRGMRRDGVTHDETIVALAQRQARLATVAVTDLTDSSGGTASSTRTVAGTTDATATAASGSNLADKTTTDAAVVTVVDAVAELFAKANAAAAAVGVTGVTYNGGGAAADGTVGAVTVSVTGATTGVSATTWNAFTGGVNQAFASLAGLVNRLAAAVGDNGVTETTSKDYLATVPAIPTATGAATAPAATKVKVDADLAQFRTNVATFAARLNSMTGTAPAPDIVVTP